MATEAERLLTLFKDPAVIELMVNEDGTVFVEKGAVLERQEFKAGSDAVAGFLKAVVGEEDGFGPRRPFADLTATDGSRVHVIAPPLVRGGLCVTLRKRPSRRPTLAEMVKGGALTEACAGFLKYAVAQRRNMLVVGGASSGKTTLLNALADLADIRDRILVLEDSPELTLSQPHVLYLRTRLRDSGGAADVTLADLLVNALRMRPDRILVGECRSVEASDMLQAMNVGNEGVMATLHASSAREGLQRLETLVLMSGIDLPLKAVRQNIVQGVDLVVFMARTSDGLRRVAQVAEVTGMEMEIISVMDLFKVESRKSPQGASFELKPTGVTPRFYDGLRFQGHEPPIEFFRK